MNIKIIAGCESSLKLVHTCDVEALFIGPKWFPANFGLWRSRYKIDNSDVMLYVVKHDIVRDKFLTLLQLN